MTWTEVERWPVSRKRRMLEWLAERREAESKKLGAAANRGASSGRGSGGGTNRGPGGYTAPPTRPPVLSGEPEPPSRPAVDPPSGPAGAETPSGAQAPQDAPGGTG